MQTEDFTSQGKLLSSKRKMLAENLIKCLMDSHGIIDCLKGKSSDQICVSIFKCIFVNMCVDI